MRTTRRAVCALLAACLLSATVNADESSANVNEAINKALNMLETPENAPDWLKRTTFDIGVEENYKPTWNLETVQPINQFYADDMLFWQFHTSLRGNVDTYNLGLGYRNIIHPEVMLGINSFYDYQNKNNHERWSVGVEAIGKLAEFRANRYMAITNKKEVSTGVFEEVLDGWDAELGGSIIPSFPLKLFASYTVWDAKQTDDLKQKAVRLEYFLNDSITLGMKYTHDNNKQGSMDQNRLMAQMTVSLGTKSPTSMNVEQATDLHERLLIPVKREHDLIIEKSVSANIKIGRGS
jgi:hypothetical protein